MKLKTLATMRPLLSGEIRERFLSFFERQKHIRMPSASLIPVNDPSLMFTNAGMVPFKDVFMGVAERPDSNLRVTTAQRCVRAGGKHNDLDQVGYTARHHTLFEMLGNFSFADYGKAEAIEMAWFFITDRESGLGIPPAMLRVTVLEGDRETAALWQRIAGLDSSQIVECGREDNFWSMGDKGPCGPCTEIFFDQGREVDGSRWLELWNLVFMQYDSIGPGIALRPLEYTSIDTGMGLERVTAVLQGQPTNYDTDVFQTLIDGIFSQIQLSKAVSGVGISHQPHLSASQRTAVRIIADHVRAVTCLIGDGVLPSAAGRGYVLRRIIRRAVRYSTQLQQGSGGVPKPILFTLVPIVVEALAIVHPDLRQRQVFIETVLAAEEEAFLSTIKRGERLLLDSLRLVTSTSAPSTTAGCDTKSGILPGSVAFELYDRYGFPFDLTSVICREQAVLVDEVGFRALLDAQRTQSRSAWVGSGDALIPAAVKSWRLQHLFPGRSSDAVYALPHMLPIATLSTATVSDSPPVAWSTPVVVTAVVDDEAAQGVWISIEPCPFYAQGGGQSSDTGYLCFADQPSLRFAVRSVLRPYDHGVAILLDNTAQTTNSSSLPGSTILSLHDTLSAVRIGTKMVAVVDGTARVACSRHHSATHMLHSALRKELGAHITQAGSNVDASRLRFDYTHPTALSLQQLESVEQRCNAMALSGEGVVTRIVPFREAVDMHKATALFSQKYGESVRMVQLGSESIELCGGTHVRQLSDCYPVVINLEASIGAGVRRIEAVAGSTAVALTLQHSALVRRVANQFGVSVRELEQRWLKGGAGGIGGTGQAMKTDELTAEILESMSSAYGSIACTLHRLDDCALLVPFSETSGLVDRTSADDAKTEKRVEKAANRLMQSTLRDMLKSPHATPLLVLLLGRRVAIARSDNCMANAAEMLQSILEKHGGTGNGKPTQAQGLFGSLVPTLSELTSTINLLKPKVL